MVAAALGERDGALHRGAPALAGHHATAPPHDVAVLWVLQHVLDLGDEALALVNGQGGDAGLDVAGQVLWRHHRELIVCPLQGRGGAYSVGGAIREVAQLRSPGAGRVGEGGGAAVEAQSAELLVGETLQEAAPVGGDQRQDP